MNPRTAFAVAALALLAACATPATRRGDTPAQAFDSKLNPEAAANCIAAAVDEAVSGLMGEGADIRHADATYSVQLTVEIHGVLFLADVVPAAAGSTVTIYDKWFIGRDKVRAGMERCH